MNSYKLNGQAGHHFRQTIVTGLNIEWKDLYKIVKDIDQYGVITTINDKKYKLELKEVKNDKNTNN